MAVAKKYLAVTGRDKKILAFLFRNKVLNLRQIEIMFFNGKHKSTAGRRMTRLFEYKLVKKRFYYEKNKAFIAYTITKKGIDCIREFIPACIDSDRYETDSIEHDLALGTITHIFEKLEVIHSTVSEAELLSCSEYMEDSELIHYVSIRSDRAMLVETTTGPRYSSLEYERSLKSKFRNKVKLEDYYLNSEIPAVFYVCENDTILKSLMKIDARITQNKKSKIYFATKSHILENQTQLIFKRHDGKDFVFR